MLAKDIIIKVRTLVGFSKHELQTPSCSIDELNDLVNCPEVGAECRVFPNAPVAGSALSQIHEYAINAGIVRCGEEIKVLAILTERDSVNGVYDFLLGPPV